MTGSAPFFSVVTATYQADRMLPALLDSVLHQAESSWEWLVQDGGSTDRTVELLSAARDPRIQVVSEPDGGIYDGLNRAIARARGDYVLVLGADDELADSDVLRNVRRLVERAARRPDVVLGVAQVGRDELFRSSLGVRTLLVNTVHHQGAFYARSEFAGFEFDQRASVVADYEHSLRLLLGRAHTLRADLVIARCGDGGVSRTSDQRDLYAQMHALRSKHMPAAFSKMLEIAGMANVGRRTLQRRMRRVPASEA